MSHSVFLFKNVVVISSLAMKRAIKLEPHSKNKLCRMSNNLDDYKVWC